MGAIAPNSGSGNCLSRHPKRPHFALVWINEPSWSGSTLSGPIHTSETVEIPTLFFAHFRHSPFVGVVLPRSQVRHNV